MTSFESEFEAILSVVSALFKAVSVDRCPLEIIVGIVEESSNFDVDCCESLSVIDCVVVEVPTPVVMIKVAAPDTIEDVPTVDTELVVTGAVLESESE